MDSITSHDPLLAAPGIHLLAAHCPIPGLGLLPMNAFLIGGSAPALVDTGPRATRAALLAHLATLIDLEDLRWICVTHADPDHVGALPELLSAAPRARVVSSFLGLAKLGLAGVLEPERGHLIEPGQALSLGDRALVAKRPPVYDAPETLAFFEPGSQSLFSADTFGAPLAAPVASASDVAPAALRDGMLTWASIDAPWLAHVPDAGFAALLGEVSRLSPRAIFSAHLPPALDLTPGLLEILAGAPDAAASAPRAAGVVRP